jgi:hypothetical protein
MLITVDSINRTITRRLAETNDIARSWCVRECECGDVHLNEKKEEEYSVYYDSPIALCPTLVKDIVEKIPADERLHIIYVTVTKDNHEKRTMNQVMDILKTFPQISERTIVITEDRAVFKLLDKMPLLGMYDTFTGNCDDNSKVRFIMIVLYASIKSKYQYGYVYIHDLNNLRQLVLTDAVGSPSTSRHLTIDLYDFTECSLKNKQDQPTVSKCSLCENV